MGTDQAAGQGNLVGDVPRILLVDDEEDIITSLAEVLRMAIPKAEVRTAQSGAEALELLDERPVDLIMTDYRMPEMNGLELLTKVAEAHPDTRRVLMTAYPDTGLAIRAINENHIDRFLAKPLEPADTVEVAQLLVRTRRAALSREKAFERSMKLMEERLERKGDEDATS